MSVPAVGFGLCPSSQSLAQIYRTRPHSAWFSWDVVAQVSLYIVFYSEVLKDGMLKVKGERS